jgi:hypothetical protein
VAISNKHSRRIVVDGVQYRWRVPPAVVYDRYIVANVWRECASGQHLRLIGGYPFSEYYPTEPMTPKLVAEGIRRALAAGWNPDEPGQPFLLRIPRLRPGEYGGGVGWAEATADANKQPNVERPCSG